MNIERSDNVSNAWTVERIRLKLESLRGDPKTNDGDAHVSGRALRLPVQWTAFAKHWLPSLSISVQPELLEIVGEFVGSTAWWNAILRDDMLAAQRLPAAERARRVGFMPQAKWDQLLGFFRRDGRNPDKGRQLDPALVPLIRQIQALLASPLPGRRRMLSQRRCAWLIADLFKAVLPIERVYGSETIRKVLRAIPKPSE